MRKFGSRIGGFLWALKIAGFVFMLASGPSEAQVCFDGKEQSQFTVIQQAPPPIFDGEQGYAYQPASAISTMSLRGLQTSRSTIPVYFFQWANHGPRRVQKSNLAIGVHPGSGTTVFFSSSEAADACTLAQTSALLGLELPGASLAAGNVARRAEALQATLRTFVSFRTRPCRTVS